MMLLGLLAAGCAGPRPSETAIGSQPPRLAPEEAVMDDGYRLPLRVWGNDRHPRALVLALHGFNDYGKAFAGLGPYLAEHGILTYAYDQRGFGADEQAGRWAGTARMAADLRAVTDLLRKRHPNTPLYLLGESMGGALVMASDTAAGADGIVLVAPAVWSRDTMNPVQRLALWIAIHTVPWLELTGEGLDIHPSDNLEMLRAFRGDPLVIKETRVDALWGITNLMDSAAGAAHRLPARTLLLYGEKDEIIPKNAFCEMVKNLPQDPGPRIVLYARGWHMLTRDLQGERVMADIARWLLDQEAALPSNEEASGRAARMARFCGQQAAPREHARS